jgi:uncharacterized protein YndB with AHSA1/START domain
MMLTLSKPPVAQTNLLMRAPVETCFNAFIDPAITTKFWFTRGSGKLEAGKRVRWFWEMYGYETEVDVKAIEPNRRILIEWSFPNSNLVEWTFAPQPLGTMVEITNTDFKGDGDAQVQTAIDSMGGWCFVLAGLKAWLEHGIEPNLVDDKWPEKHVGGWKGRSS